MNYIKYSKGLRRNFKCIAAIIIVLLGAACAGAALAANDEVKVTLPSVQSVIDFLKAFVNFLISIFLSINNWLKSTIGFNFTDLFNIFIQVITWFIQVLIGLFNWAPGAQT